MSAYISVHALQPEMVGVRISRDVIGSALTDHRHVKGRLLEWQVFIFRFGWLCFRGFLEGDVLAREVYRLAGEQIGDRE